MTAWRSSVVAVATCGAILAGCAGDGGGSGETGGIEVVATTSILGDVVEQVLGDTGGLHVLVPAGVDPHAFEPSAAEVTRLREADVVIANGLELEADLLDALRSAEDDGVRVLRVAEEVDPIRFSAVGHEHDDEHEHDDDEDGGAAGDDDHGDEALDPHFWFDPIRMADAVSLIGERLADAAPGSAEQIRRNADRYRGQVLDLHEQVAEILAAIPADDRELVTNHDTLGYLAARYDLEVIGTVVPGGTTLGESSSREIAELVETVRRAEVPAIFVDTTAPDRLARTVSGELGGDVEVVELYTESLGPDGSGADTYLGLIETNARRIADGLTG